MNQPVSIHGVRFRAAPPEEARRGLIGWISLIMDKRLRLAGISLRRTRDGRMTLSFPARTDGAGRKRFYVRPLNDVTRREIERQVFTQLGFAEAKSR